METFLKNANTLMKSSMGSERFGIHLEPKYLTDFVHGVMHGEHISWYLTGHIALAASTVNNNYHGLFTAYWPNGQMREQGYFVEGERTGVFKSWSDKGELLSEKNHDD